MVKLREIGYLLGRRPAAQTYGFEVRAFELAREGRIEYARWLHPKETPKQLTQESVDQLRAFLRPGDVAIDIGAHTGDTSIPMALAAWKEGVVLAVEPNPYVFPVLRKNCELNRAKTNIVALPFAATAKDGEYEFEYGDAGYCNGGLHQKVSRWKHGLAFKLRVRGRNLAEYLEEQHPELTGRIRYIKVDAEGYDLQVLLSLRPIIRRSHPFVRAEVFKWTGARERRRLLEFLEGEGYTVRRVESEENYCAEIVRPEGAMQWRHYDIFAIPAGCAIAAVNEPERDTAWRQRTKEPKKSGPARRN